MSKFRVGQRVRIVGTGPNDKFSWAVGHEAVVSGFWSGWGRGSDEYRDDWVEVCVEALGLADCICRPSELEPATDSYDVVSWDACVWKPEHLRMGA